jgi:hypothetical protein
VEALKFCKDRETIKDIDGIRKKWEVTQKYWRKNYKIDKEKPHNQMVRNMRKEKKSR